MSARRRGPAGVALVAAACAIAGRPALAQSPASRSIRGAVYDSLAHAPLAHALVSIVNRTDDSVAPRSVRADGTGAFEFPNLEPGVYLIGFQAPLLDSLGINSPTRLVQLGSDGHGAVVADLAVPSGHTIHDVFCPNRPKSDSSSLFVGHLGDAMTLGAIAGGEVDATWLDITRDKKKKLTVDPRMAQTHSGPDGWFALCDLPANATVAVHAIATHDTSGVIYFQMPEARGLVRHDVFLADGKAPRSGVVVGRVTATDGGQAVTGAQLRADATGATVTSGDSGKFALSGLPYGSSDILVRSIGFVPQRLTVSVLAGAPTRLDVSLLTSANVLDTVIVRAARTIADESGWNERRKAGWGRYFDEDAINRMQPFETADIVRHVTGARFMSSGFDSKIMMYNPAGGGYNCPPEYFLDGHQLHGIVTTADLEVLAPPEELAAVEVYTDYMTVPPQFDGGRACGAIVMWSLPPSLWNRHRGRP